MIRNLLIASLVTIFFSCSKKEKHFNNFDFTSWKSDRGGCATIRQQKIDELKKLKEEMKGLSQNEVFDYFGRYDLQLLDSRNQKAFVYFLEKGGQCEEPKKDYSQTPTMVIRFNAVSLVNEVDFVIGIP